MQTSARARARTKEYADLADIRDVLRTEKTTRSSVELSDSVWERLKEIASKSFKTTTKRFTRDEIMEHFFEWCFQELDRVAAGRLHPEADRVLEMLREEGQTSLGEKLRARLVAELKKGMKR